MRFVLAALVAAWLVVSVSAVIHGNTTAFCIANANAKTVCTNHCKVGATCVASCKGESRRVKIDPKSGRAGWADKDNSKAKSSHIIQDEHECSNYPEKPKHAPMCPRTTKYFKTALCMDVQSGKTAKPGQRGLI